MSNDEETLPQPLPTWLSIPIILVCLGGGGWIIHWYMLTDTLAQETHILGDSPATPAATAAQQARRTPGGWGGGWGAPPTVRELGQDRYAFRGAKSEAVADFREGRRILRVAYSANLPEFAGPDEKVIKAAERLVNPRSRDTAKLDAMKLDEKSRRTVQGLAEIPTVALSPDQREEILVTFAAWRSAGKNEQQKADAANKLKKLIDDSSTASLPTTKTQIADRAAKINALITPEQWKIANDYGGGK